MTTKLDRPLKREITIDDKPFTLTIDAGGLKEGGLARRHVPGVQVERIRLGHSGQQG